jgi:diaminopimelate decarboxylase
LTADQFVHRDGVLHCEDVALPAIADHFGTPTYVYSKAALTASYRELTEAFAAVPHLICYSLKSNGNLSVGRTLAALGAGADIVSGGELYRATRMGIPGSKIVYSSVGKTADEIERALRADILMFNVESHPELELIDVVARRLGKIAPVALRVNPDIDPQTHPYITTGMKKYKFGVPIEEVVPLYRLAADLPGVTPVGLQMHLGSQLVNVRPIVEASQRLAVLWRQLAEQGIRLRYLDVGGGLAIRYKDEEPESPVALAAALVPLVRDLDCTLILEPGRFLTGRAGVLLTRVLYVKKNDLKTFVVVDAAMNDLIRPSLYDAYHPIDTVVARSQSEQVDIVGPVCESGDFFAHDRLLGCCQSGDLIAIKNAGAYGFTMSSNYNARPRAAEVLVDGRQAQLARRRERYEDLIRGEED